MRKLNATLLNEGNKEEAILKIKDDSFTITSNEQMIKIPYSNIKSFNFDEQNEVLSIVKFGGNPIELNIVKDKQLLELLNSITSQNKSDSSESIPTYESKSPKENERKLERNATIRDTDNKKTEIKANNENKKEPTNSGGYLAIIVGVFIVGIIIFGAKSLFFDNTSSKDNSNKNKDLSTFEINDTCWGDDNTGYCFDNGYVYYIKMVNNEIIATKYDNDKSTLIEVSNTKGKFYNTEYTRDYEIINNNGNFSLNVTHKLIDDVVTFDYKQLKQKASNLKFTEPKISLNILGNEITMDYSNYWSNLMIYLKLTSNTLTIKDKNGNVTNTQGYKFKAYGDKLIYMKENEYNLALQVSASRVLDEHTLCYKINNGTKQTNFLQMKTAEGVAIENISIHYCDNLS